MFSLFGPDTLRELRAAFEEVDTATHTLRFVDMHDIGDMLVHSGWSTPVMDMETVTVTYESPETLLREVQPSAACARIRPCAVPACMADAGTRRSAWRWRAGAMPTA